LFFFFAIERSPPIEEVIQADVIPLFVEFLFKENFPQLQVLHLNFVVFLVVEIYYLFMLNVFC